MSVADALEQVSTGPWSGRAAERFRERFGAEPERWRNAGHQLNEAAEAIEQYAAALERVQLAGGRGDGERDQLQLPATPLDASIAAPTDPTRERDDPGAIDAGQAHTVESLLSAASRATAQLRRLGQLAPQERTWPDAAPWAPRPAAHLAGAATSVGPGGPDGGDAPPSAELSPGAAAHLVEPPHDADWATLFAGAEPTPWPVHWPEHLQQWRAEWAEPADDLVPAWPTTHDFAPGPLLAIGAHGAGPHAPAPDR